MAQKTIHDWIWALTGLLFPRKVTLLPDLAPQPGSRATAAEEPTFQTTQLSAYPD